MFRVLTCLATQHDFRLVLLAALICGGTSFTAFSIYSRAVAAQGLKRSGWLILTGVCTASGIWATHFVAMLAYQGPVPISYEPVITAASLLLAIPVTTLGFFICTGRSRPAIAAGGVIVGCGIGLMHFTGMSALILPGTIAWDPWLVAWSLALGAGLTAAATLAYHRFGGARAMWAGAGLLTLAICALHFTAMGAATIIPDPTAAYSPSTMDSATMAVTIAGLTLLVMLSGLSAALIDRQTSEETIERFRQLVDAAFEGIVVARDGEILDANRRISELSGQSLAGLVGKSVFGDLLDLSARLPGSGDIQATEALLKKTNGETVAVEVVRRPFHSGLQGNEVYAIRDLTDQLRAEAVLAHKRDLERLNEWLDIALNNMKRGLSMFDREQRLVVCNQFYREIYDLPDMLARPGTSFAEIVRYFVERETGRNSPADIENQGRWIARHVAELARGKSFDRPRHMPDGRTILVTHQPLARGGWVDIHEDVTERRRAEATIAHMAHYDALTNLPNRLLLREHLERLLAGSGTDGLAVLCLDLDGFKLVNDTLGHGIGDALLKAVAERLACCVKGTDMVARLGGDEFAIVQAEVRDGNAPRDLAARILETVSAPYELGGHRVIIGTSIGIALAPKDGDDPATLLKHADLALYRSKKEGRGVSTFFDPGMSAEVHARRSLEDDLRDAIQSRELELFYQPIVDVGNKELTGFEALLRWRHPERGIVPPSEFIPFAEETGLIIPIGTWALREACARAQSWPKEFKVAVNVSPVQLKQRNFVESILLTLAATGLSPHRLELEITESVLTDTTGATLATLRQLHDLGVRIALDDFGTGYSSLGYLRMLPCDKIKIDRSFINDLQHGGESALAIVRAVAGLGSALGLTICAEGVETEQQLAKVRAEGCTEMQGYLVSRPLPLEEIERLYLAPPKSVASVA